MTDEDKKDFEEINKAAEEANVSEGENKPDEVTQNQSEVETTTNPTEKSENADETSNIDFPSVNIENPDNWVDVVNPVDTGTPPTTNATFSVTADKSTVKEGEFVTFTIVTTNVAIGTKFDYNLVGSNITPSDFISNTLTGVFVVEDFGDYNAKVVWGHDPVTWLDWKKAPMFYYD